jgi:Tripartite tricarboxylate transporter TctB family
VNKKLLTGIIFILFAVTFGAVSTGYRLGHLDNPGPALFPLIISGALAILGIINLIEGTVLEKVTANFKLKNIAIITSSLIVFAILSESLNMIAGIVALITISSAATTPYSVSRTIKITASLVAIAFAFKYLLGVNLPL